jgi:transcriptional regulator with XRE-family HTH domain
VPSGPGPYQPQPGAAKAVRVLREEAKLSQKELAQRAGMSASWLSRIESGDYDPSWSSMRKVARGLGVSMETLAEIAGDYDEPEPA